MQFEARIKLLRESLLVPFALVKFGWRNRQRLQVELVCPLGVHAWISGGGATGSAASGASWSDGNVGHRHKAGSRTIYAVKLLETAQCQ